MARAVKTTRTPPAPTQPAAAPPRAPVVSTGELRAQLEKLERANATLRAKGREANKAAKAAAARIAELEDEVTRMAKRPAPIPVTRAKRASAKPQGREVDPGDAVPPGVAPQAPQPLDQEAEAALGQLEEHLGGDPS